MKIDFLVYYQSEKFKLSTSPGVTWTVLYWILAAYFLLPDLWLLWCMGACDAHGPLAPVHADSRNAGKFIPMESSFTIVGCKLMDKCFLIVSPGQAMKIFISLRSFREFHRIEFHFPILVANSLMHHPIDFFSPSLP